MFARFSIVEPSSTALEPLFAATQGVATSLGATDDVAHAKAWLGFPFEVSSETGPHLRLVGISALGRSRAGLDARWGDVDRVLGVEGARFDLDAELVRAVGGGWGPDIRAEDHRPIRGDEPVLTVVTGELVPEHVDAFMAAAQPVVAQAFADPAYLGGCTLVSSMLDITSFSCWRTARDARRFGYGEGAHTVARLADEAEGWHDPTTTLYATYRVLASSGSLLGDTPFERAPAG